VRCLVLETGAPEILNGANVGIDDKCHLPRSVHSTRSVQATTNSMTVTELTKRQILLFFIWRSDDTQTLISRYTDGIHSDTLADFLATKI
jgi:hypothetical protein